MSIAIHITPGASFAVAVVLEEPETRWCFGCRKRTVHAWSLLEDPPERQPSYYDAVPACRCLRCKKERTGFPGSYLDGPRYPSEEVWEQLVQAAAVKRASPAYQARLPEEMRS